MLVKVRFTETREYIAEIETTHAGVAGHVRDLDDLGERDQAQIMRTCPVQGDDVREIRRARRRILVDIVPA